MSAVATPLAVDLLRTVDLLRFEPQLTNTGILFQALIQAGALNGVEVTDTATYRGQSRLLLMWGPGAEARSAVMAKHVAAGGHVICFDAAYWQRHLKYRLSIDRAHPQAWVMRRDWPRDRVIADGITVSSDWRPNGPVVVAGLGRKARAQFGPDAVTAWEVEMMRAAQARWPKRAVWYRAKPGSQAAPLPPGVRTAPAGPIERTLTGASLLVTWHSNVAVDAIRQGIAVICRDGAAAAVCPSSLGEQDPEPLEPTLRDRFLSNLAWFQWGTTPTEAAGCWRFLRELLA